MKYIFIVMALALFSSFSYAEDPDQSEKLIQQTEQCIHSNIGIEAKRTCYEKCVENASYNLMSKICLGFGLDAEFAELDRVYNTSIMTLDKAISASDEYSKRYNEELKHRLIESQSAWDNYAKINCRFEATEMLFGTGEGGVYLGCMIGETRKRTEQVSRLVVVY